MDDLRDVGVQAMDQVYELEAGEEQNDDWDKEADNAATDCFDLLFAVEVETGDWPAENIDLLERSFYSTVDCRAFIYHFLNLNSIIFLIKW